MSVSSLGEGCAGCPVCPGAHRLRPRRDGLLPCRWDCSCWLCRCGQRGDARPAGGERVLPGPVTADFQGAAACVTDGSGGDMPQSVTERVRLGVLEVIDVVQA